MYQVKVYKDKEFDVYELVNSEAESWLKVVPERGGIIIGFGVDGEETLFLNKETLYNPDKNIRGGIPILFPISGQLDNGEYEWNGKVYQMKNHGVARNNPWEVMNTKANEEQASMTLCLKSNQETKKEFPFDFELIFTYTIGAGGLDIQQQYINHSDSPMPMYPGFHPYFRTTHKDLSYITDAKTYLDYNDMEIKVIKGSLDLTEKKESFALLDAAKREIEFELPERKKTFVLTYGEEFKYVVLWTEKDQDFVCVEPWMALTNELNRKEELVIVQPGKALKTTMRISIQ
ncbi:aldose epimerase family protein [Neobacillus ginsengisoli]|uniref:Galactose mutarotase-like enzyme n=1 Tax=Neobacillus ginsengisoli TaxID=904295 RepID=A0ABT9XU37_9BACI|nr:aldose epimerase [Neobacillus ginsengisoli]MDQ0198810.1 galactose mutarotase-like enzyme [Neobacillus ginsengisoli]